MTIDRELALMRLGDETAKVILEELQKMDASQGELLLVLEQFTVHLITGIDISKGKEGKLLATVRENVMRRTARARLLMNGTEDAGSPYGDEPQQAGDPGPGHDI